MNDMDVWAPLIFTALRIASGGVAALFALLCMGLAMWSSDRPMAARLTLAAAGITDLFSALLFVFLLPAILSAAATQGLQAEQFSWLVAAESSAALALHCIWLLLLAASFYFFARTEEPDLSTSTEY